MSYPDHPPLPPLPFMLAPFPGGNADGFWPQIPLNRDYPDSHSQFEHPPPFKRLRNSENNPNSVPFPSTNPRMNPPNPPMNKGTTHIFYKTRMCAKFLENMCRNGDNCTFAHGSEDLREPPPNWQELVKDRVAGNWNDDQRIIHRMKICKKFYNGEECPYGEKCNFLHESPAKFRTDFAGEMARTRQSSVISIEAMGSMEHRSVNDHSDLNKHVNSSSDAFQVYMNGNSDVSRVNENANSDVSRFSVNSNSDRVAMNANSDAFRATVKTAYWKTKICSKWEIGLCPFGDRCHFAHGLSDLQVPNGRSELPELMMRSGSVAAKPSAVVTVSDVPPTVAVVTAPIKEEGEVKKGFAKWNAHKKINRIYADWIDDLTPPHSLPSQVEN